MTSQVSVVGMETLIREVKATRDAADTLKYKDLLRSLHTFMQEMFYILQTQDIFLSKSMFYKLHVIDAFFVHAVDTVSESLGEQEAVEAFKSILDVVIRTFNERVESAKAEVEFNKLLEERGKVWKTTISHREH